MKEIKPFDFKRIEDFDRHIELSIPNYQTLNNIFTWIATEFSQSEGLVVDLGCSTGRFLSSLPKAEGCEYLGIDKVKMETHDGFSFIEGDCEEELDNLKDISVIVSMFFLQFLGEYKRRRILKQIKSYINDGCVFLVAEKVYLNDTRLQTLIHRMHVQSKRNNFTDEEILNKDQQLSISMFCKKEKDLENELKELGDITKVWQSYNFLAYVVQKNNE
tara:strand:- start:1038 stop:1688 length:651 start_codon:yes stop_codon:yes gene_type:complete